MKKNKKKFYINCEKAGKRGTDLSSTIKGILITTDRKKEKEAIRDAYNILNDVVEEIYPELTVDSETTNNTRINITSTSDLLESELSNLREKKKRFFFNFDTNVKGLLFIKVDDKFKDLIDVNKITMCIIEKIKKSGEQLSRCICRFLPIQIGFKAKYENFVKYAPDILDKYFKKANIDKFKLEPLLTWKVEYKCRNNNSMKRDDFQKFLLGYINKENYRVDLKNPDVVILIEICNDLICLSVIPDYYQNKCFNLMELGTNSTNDVKKKKIVSLEKNKITNEKTEKINPREEEKCESEEDDEEGIKLI